LGFGRDRGFKTKRFRKAEMAKRLLIGVDLGGTNVRAGLVGKDRLLKLSSRPIRSGGTADEVFADLCDTIDAVFDKKAAGLGIGVPSLVNSRDGSIFDTTNIPSWKKVPLRKKLEKRYGVPIRVDNDANCFALGQRYYGQGKTVENFVAVVLGTGLGAGIISRGHLLSGTDCGAGEFGTVPYLDSTVENYASGAFFKKKNWEGQALAAAAAKGDQAALAIFKEYGSHLAFAFKLILYALAPEMIVLGGSVSRSYPFFESSLREGLADFAYPSVVAKLKIKPTRLKEAAVLGAASLLLD
jgi:glucokinase